MSRNIGTPTEQEITLSNMGTSKQMDTGRPSTIFTLNRALEIAENIKKYLHSGKKQNTTQLEIHFKSKFVKDIPTAKIRISGTLKDVEAAIYNLSLKEGFKSITAIVFENEQKIIANVNMTNDIETVTEQKIAFGNMGRSDQMDTGRPSQMFTFNRAVEITQYIKTKLHMKKHKPRDLEIHFKSKYVEKIPSAKIQVQGTHEDVEDTIYRLSLMDGFRAIKAIAFPNGQNIIATVEM